MHITHLFNVSSFHHRSVGLCNFGMVKAFPKLPKFSGICTPSVEVVGDLLHVYSHSFIPMIHFCSDSLAIQCLLDQNRDDVCFVTDAMAVSTGTRVFSYCGRELEVSQGKVTLRGFLLTF